MLRYSIVRFFSRAQHSTAEAKFTALLRKNSKPKSIRECEQIHAKIIVSKKNSELHVANTLLNLYFRCGEFEDARRLFDQMPLKNVVTWTTLISGYAHRGIFEKGLNFFKEMLEFGERPNQFTFSVVIRACIGLGFVNLGLQVHGLIVCFGLESDEFAGSSLVDMYFKLGGNLDGAWCVFNGLFKRDCVTWNVMISGFAQFGECSEVWRLFSEMRFVDGLEPNDFTFASVLKCCCLFKEVEQIHGLALKSGTEFDVVLGSALVDVYVKCGDMVSGRKVLDSMEGKDCFVWSSIILAYARNGRGEEAIILFREMCRHGIRPDQHALSSTLKACAEIGDLNTGVQVHTQMTKNGYQSDCFVASVLLTLYADASEISEAEKLFRRIENKDIVAWSSMILGYAQREDGSASCIGMFRELCQTTFLRPDGGTLIAVLKSCQSNSDLLAGSQIHSLILKSSQSREISVGNAVIHMYSECGATEDAYKAFRDMVYKDDISWSSVIGNYQQNGLESEALRICKEMMADGIQLTSFSLPLCIAACSELAAMYMGKQFHSFVIKLGFDRDVYVGSSIVDMYAKCGNMEESKRAFDEQQEPNEVTFNAVISGFGKHGKALEAIKVFNEMEKMSLTPNHSTFLAVLSACSHAGFIEESLYFFQLMHQKYDMKPESEHYSCLVDVYGRVGRLEEAYVIIKDDGSVSAWRTLLSACRMYRNAKIAEKSARKLIELDPSDHASYILLSNIYSGEGKWEEALKLRQKMVDVGVKKDPGSSWLIFS